MQNDRALQTASRLLVLKRATRPMFEEIDLLTEEMRRIVAENHNQRMEVAVPNLGTVLATAASMRKLRGVEDILNLSNWLKLDEGERGRLKALNVVEVTEIYTQARKSAVSVALAPFEPSGCAGADTTIQFKNSLPSFCNFNASTMTSTLAPAED
jgi:hypothetical protein